MKKIVSLFVALIILFSFLNLTFARKGGYVKGYYRKNGTYVSPHYRSGSASTSKSYTSYEYSKSNNREGTYVKGYYRKDGTYVSPHYRSGSASTPKSIKTYKPKSSKSQKTYKYSESKYLTNSKIKVIDGDTFYYEGKKYRVSGIDTPEKGQYNFERAKNKLETLLKYGSVEINEMAKDKYGRTVAKVRVNGEYVSDILRREGLQKTK